MTTKRNILVTGATGAIGKATVTELIKHPDVHLILIGRNAASLTQLKEELLKINSKNTVDIIVTNLSELKIAVHTCHNIINTYPTLFAFINLAAIIKKQKLLTVDNIETMFATNYLVPFHLATTLSDFYKEALKVIFVTSSSTSAIDFSNLQGEIKFSAIPNFSQSKTCNVLFIKKLSRQFESSGCRAIGYDPGL